MIRRMIYTVGVTLSIVTIMLTSGCRASVEVGDEARSEPGSTLFWTV